MVISEQTVVSKSETQALPQRSVLGRGFWAGIIGGTAMMALMWLLNILFGHYTLPQAIDPIIVKLLPGEAFSTGIQTFGKAGHAIEIVVLVVAIIVAGGLLGMLYAALFGRRTATIAAHETDQPSNNGLVPALVAGAIFAVGVWVFVYGLLIPGLERLVTYDSALDLYRGVGPFGTNLGSSSVTSEGTVGFIIMSLATFLLFGLTLSGIFNYDVRETTKAWRTRQTSDAAAQPGRRRALRQVAGGVAVVAGAALGARYITSEGVGLNRAGQGPTVEEPSSPNVQPGGDTTQPGIVVEDTPEPDAIMDTPEPGAAPEGADTPVPNSYQNNYVSVAEMPSDLPPLLATPAALSEAGMPSVATPNSTFYHVSKNTTDPVLGREGSTLKITGLVDRPLEIKFADLIKEPSLFRYITLSCISNPVGGSLIGNGKWKGTPLAGLLKKAGVKANAKRVVFICSDDYTDSIPLAIAQHDYNMIAWELNGEWLPSKSGAPIRALIPGIFGMKNAKWIKEIRLVDDANYKGFWAQQGWDNAAPTRTMSIFYIPKRFVDAKAGAQLLGGVAFAGDRGIRKVEVSIDGGKTWKAATLKQPLSRYSWVLWTMPWSPTPGKYTLLTRATDGNGVLQKDSTNGGTKDAYPSGVESYDRLEVNVK